VRLRARQPLLERVVTEHGHSVPGEDQRRGLDRYGRRGGGKSASGRRCSRERAGRPGGRERAQSRLGAPLSSAAAGARWSGFKAPVSLEKHVRPGMNRSLKRVVGGLSAVSQGAGGRVGCQKSVRIARSQDLQAEREFWHPSRLLARNWRVASSCGG
jgi:hypothetical protein